MPTELSDLANRRGSRTRTGGLMLPKHPRYLLRHTSKPGECSAVELHTDLTD